jgi:hypothetical protein
MRYGYTEYIGQEGSLQIGQMDKERSVTAADQLLAGCSLRREV